MWVNHAKTPCLSTTGAPRQAYIRYNVMKPINIMIIIITSFCNITDNITRRKQKAWFDWFPWLAVALSPRMARRPHRPVNSPRCAVHGSRFCQMLVVSDWCMGGWKQRTCSTGRLSASLDLRYLFNTEKIWLFRIWYFRIRSTIFFSGCTEKNSEKMKNFLVVFLLLAC